MPGSNSETWKFCDGLGSNIVEQYSVGPLNPFIVELLQGSTWTGWVLKIHPMIQTLFLSNDAVFQEDSAPIHTAGTV
jgi:hypothetical protein